jgi:tripartite-type tricarboxylate transporter receptor subunit TctC
MPSFDTRQPITRRTALQLAAGLAAMPAIAQPRAAYPSRPVQLIVPDSPGGLPATFGRMVGDQLARQLGQPVIVDNRPGAAGLLGTRALLAAPADGHTLLWTYISNQVISPLMHKPRPFHPVDDFAPIALSAVNTGGYLIANAQLPFTTPRELFAYARKQRGRLTFASAGIGSIMHLALEVIQDRTGTSIVHVPYKGNGPATLAVASGEADIGVGSSLPAIQSLLDSGRIRLIARLGERRSTEYPDVPTLAEDTVPGFILPFWMGITARAGTPPEIVRRLNEEVNAAVSGNADIRAYAAAAGLLTVSGPPSRLQEVVVRDYAVFEKVVREKNISAG